MNKNSTINSQKNRPYCHVLLHLYFTYFTRASSLFTNKDIHFFWKLFGLNYINTFFNIPILSSDQWNACYVQFFHYFPDDLWMLPVKVKRCGKHCGNEFTLSFIFSFLSSMLMQLVSRKILSTFCGAVLQVVCILQNTDLLCQTDTQSTCKLHKPEVQTWSDTVHSQKTFFFFILLIISVPVTLFCWALSSSKTILILAK